MNIGWERLAEILTPLIVGIYIIVMRKRGMEWTIAFHRKWSPGVEWNKDFFTHISWVMGLTFISVGVFNAVGLNYGGPVFIAMGLFALGFIGVAWRSYRNRSSIVGRITVAIGGLVGVVIIALGLFLIVMQLKG